MVSSWRSETRLMIISWWTDTMEFVFWIFVDEQALLELDTLRHPSQCSLSHSNGVTWSWQPLSNFNLAKTLRIDWIWSRWNLGRPARMLTLWLPLSGDPAMNFCKMAPVSRDPARTLPAKWRNYSGARLERYMTMEPLSGCLVLHILFKYSV